MAKGRHVIRLAGPATTRVRYGRAVLTIARHGDLNGGTLGKAIVAYEQGALGAKDLCQEFARVRVQKHTPSFTWHRADTERVLRLVVEASDRPRFKSTDSADVARELARAAQVEAEELKQAMERIRRRCRPRPPDSSLAAVVRAGGHPNALGLRLGGPLA